MNCCVKNVWITMATVGAFALGLAGLAIIPASATVVWDNFPAHSTGISDTANPPDYLTPEEVAGNPITWEWRGPADTPAGPWKPGLPTELFSLSQGKSSYLGLDNFFRPNETKTVELKFSYWYDEGHTVVPDTGGTWGYSGDPSRGGAQGKNNQASSTTKVVFGTPQNGMVWVDCTYTWSIKPQPDWEYVRISNSSSDSQAVMNDIQNISLRSRCTPEPSSLVLLALGGLPLVGRRRDA